MVESRERACPGARGEVHFRTSNKYLAIGTHLVSNYHYYIVCVNQASPKSAAPVPPVLPTHARFQTRTVDPPGENLGTFQVVDLQQRFALMFRHLPCFGIYASRVRLFLLANPRWRMQNNKILFVTVSQCVAACHPSGLTSMQTISCSHDRTPHLIVANCKGGPTKLYYLYHISSIVIRDCQKAFFLRQRPPNKEFESRHLP